MKNLFLTLLLASILTPALNGQCIECPACGTEAAIGFLEKTSKKQTVFSVSQKEIAVPDICTPCCWIPNFREQFNKLRYGRCDIGKCPKGDCPKQIREGTIKVVKILKKSSIKCDACAYEWKVAEIEEVNKYLYNYDPEAEKKDDSLIDPIVPKKTETAPIKVKDKPALDLDVPAAPKMGWRDRPLFKATKERIPAQPASTSSRSSYLIRKPGPAN